MPALHGAGRFGDADDPSPISTGHLPPSERVRVLVHAAYKRFKSNDEGQNASYYPALAAVPRDLFGICMTSIDGAVYTAGDTEYPFTIMSVAKRLCSHFSAARRGRK